MSNDSPTVRVLAAEENFAIVKLSEESSPSLMMHSDFLYAFVRALAACRGYVAGTSAREDAVGVSMLLERLHQILDRFEAVSIENGYNIEHPRTLEEAACKQAFAELESFLGRLPPIPDE